MKKISYFMMMAGILACSPQQEAEKIIGKHFPTIENGIFTPEVLWQFGQLSDPQVSPDGTKILYGVSYTDWTQNRNNRELFVIHVDGTDNKQITKTSGSESNARWYRDGSQIAYLSGGQLWIMDADGSNPKKISDVPAGISAFAFSPDQTKLLYISTVPSIKKPVDVYPDLPNASGRMIDDLMYRQWDQWTERIPQPFVADLDGKQLTNAVDIL